LIGLETFNDVGKNGSGPILTTVVVSAAAVAAAEIALLETNDSRLANPASVIGKPPQSAPPYG
jgi:hypothetical protein